jgi:hypothetical protein
MGTPQKNHAQILTMEQQTHMVLVVRDTTNILGIVAMVILLTMISPLQKCVVYVVVASR